MSEPMLEKWSSIEEIANHLGVSKDTIRIWIKKKKCLHIKLVSNGDLG